MNLDGKLDKLARLKSALPFLVLALCVAAMFDLPSHVGTMRDLRSSAKAPHELLQLIVGMMVGCYGTIVGIGGGPVIVPMLIFFFPWSNEVIVASSLFLVFANAFSGTWGYALQRRIDYKGGFRFAVAAIPGALLSTMIHNTVDVSSFNVIFALFLVALAIYSVLRIDRLEAGPIVAEVETGRRVLIEDAFGSRFEFYCNDKLGISLNVLLGFAVGFLGIGGGVFQVPLLIFLLGYPTHVAAATSHFVTLLTCTVALLPNIILGNVPFGQLLWLGAGVIVGAQVGARVSAKLPSKTIMGLFALVLFVLAALLVFNR
jgi:uncharacterized membrane protein YfcA